jgi:hypothetical protein
MARRVMGLAEVAERGREPRRRFGMRARRLTLIAVTDGIETLEQETTCGAMACRVRARIARRPGRWRERMHEPAAAAGEEQGCPEAA